MRLKDADELKEWVENWFEKNRYYHPHSKANNIPISELYDILERMPTVETEPIKHGHWIDHTYKYRYPVGRYECSICGTAHDMEWDYCPSCGARMDGDDT